MMNAPAPVMDKQLKELSIRIVADGAPKGNQRPVAFATRCIVPIVGHRRAADCEQSEPFG